MRSSVVVLFLAVASAAAAQTNSIPVTTASATAFIPGNCPIGIVALQQPRNPYLLTDNSHAMHPTYHVTIRPRTGRAIQQVELSLSGPSGLHLGNASTAELADATETITLHGEGEMTITPKKLTAVAFFSLVSVTYINGSHWHRNSTNVCNVTPNGFVPVK